LSPRTASTRGSTLCKSATPCSRRGGEPLRELLILSVVLTAVAVAIYISFS
jgi:hypothetical protein